MQPSSPISDDRSARAIANALAQFGSDYKDLVFDRFTSPPATIDDAASSQAPTFALVTNYFSREATLFWLRKHIAETFAFIGIYDTASIMQIRQTAELVLDHEVFSQLNLDEFLLFLKKFKRGDYGKIYQSARPNPQEFLACLRPFWNELLDHRIRAAQAEQQRRLDEQRPAAPPTPEERQKIDQIRERLAKRFGLPFGKTRTSQ